MQTNRMQPLNKFLSRIPEIKINNSSRTLLKEALIVLATIGSGIFVARLIVSGQWHIAAIMIFSIPAIFILQRYPFLSILAWLVFAPFLMNTSSVTLRQVYWVVHRFLPLLTLGTILLPSALGISRRPLPRLGFPEWAMTGYAGVSLFSIVLTNQDPLGTTYLFYDRVVIPMMLYLIVRLSSPDESLLRWLVPVFFFIALSQTSIGILSWFVPRSLPAKWVDYENHRTIGTLVNTNAYVTTLILAGFMILHYGLQSSSKRMRTVSILTFLLTVYGVFISFSRAGWLAGFLALFGLTAIYPRIITRFVLTIVPVFLLVAGLFMQNQLRWAGQRFFSQDSENSALSRVPVYAAAFRMFAAKPIYGWGYGNFDRYDRQFQNPPVANIAGDNKDHASHNFFLSMIAEQGLIGILLYLAPVFYWLGLTFKHFFQLPMNGFWSRKVLVIFWMVILSHVVVYNFANMRIVFGLGGWWLTLGMIACFMDSHQSVLATEYSPAAVSKRAGNHAPKMEAGLRS